MGTTKTRMAKRAKQSMRTRTMKHSSKNKHSMSQGGIVRIFLEMLFTVKLYHWRTHSYSQHKATDELYGELNTNIDNFVETMLGKMDGSRIEMPKEYQKGDRCYYDFASLAPFNEKVNEYKQLLIHMFGDGDKENTDLMNIRDEILGTLNKFSYLLTLQ